MMALDEIEQHNKNYLARRVRGLLDRLVKIGNQVALVSTESVVTTTAMEIERGRSDIGLFRDFAGAEIDATVGKSFFEGTMDGFFITVITGVVRVDWAAAD